MSRVMDSETERVLDVARQIANRAPQRRGKYVSDCKVPWELITDLKAGIWEMDQAARRRREGRG